MFKHILLPTDGSPLSEAAVEEGIRFAKILDAKITGLCVIPEHYRFRYTAHAMKDAFRGSHGPDTELEEAFLAMVEKGKQAGRQMVEDYIGTIEKSVSDAGVDCNVLWQENDFPYEAIIKTAEQEGCDLIMMASHGRSGVKALLLGSETQKVLAHTRMPVLVHRQRPQHPKQDALYRHILLPTDGSSLSEAAVALGIDAAKRLNAKVTGLFVIPKDYPTYYDAGLPAGTRLQAEAERKAYADHHLAALSSAARKEGVACDIVREMADHPHEAIVGVAEQNNCDLIVMSSHGRKGIGAVLLGSVTQKVLVHSRMPVLVCR